MKFNATPSKPLRKIGDKVRIKKKQKPGPFLGEGGVKRIEKALRKLKTNRVVTIGDYVKNPLHKECYVMKGIPDIFIFGEDVIMPEIEIQKIIQPLFVSL